MEDLEEALVKYSNVCYLSGLVPNVLVHDLENDSDEDGCGVVQAHEVEGMAVAEVQMEVGQKVDCKGDEDDGQDMVVCLGAKVLEVHMDSSFLGVEVVQVVDHRLVLTLEEEEVNEVEANPNWVPYSHESRVGQDKGTEDDCSAEVEGEG